MVVCFVTCNKVSGFYKDNDDLFEFEGGQCIHGCVGTTFTDDNAVGLEDPSSTEAWAGGGIWLGHYVSSHPNLKLCLWANDIIGRA